MNRSGQHDARTPRKTIPSLLLCILGALAVGLASPIQAQAAVTLTKDGLESADKASCVIDIDSYRDFTFEASEGSPFRLVAQDGTFTEWQSGTEHVLYGVYVDYTPQAGVTELPGSFEITYPKGLLDADGNRHDLHVRFSNVTFKWRISPETGPVAQQLLGVTDEGLRVMAECGSMFRGSEVVHINPWASGTVNPLGVSCDIRMWNGDDATLMYNMYARDIDQPDRFTGKTASTSSYDGEWSESFAPYGTFGTFHVHKDSWLRSDGSRIHGTQSDGDEELNRSGFVSLGSMSAASPLGFVWRGSMCSSLILQDWKHNLKTRVVDGVGGTVHTKSGGETKRTIKSNTTDTWNNTNTVPKNDYVVTATPKDGYRIAAIWVDGTRIPDDEASTGVVSMPSVNGDHTVAVKFEPLGTTLSLVKASAAPGITDGNPCYSLEGAEYGVYSDKSCTKAVGTLVTTARGRSNSIVLPTGTYYVKESKASVGYALDSSVHEAKVDDAGDSLIEVTEQPQTNPLSLLALKVDAQTKKAQPQGNASLAGAQFTIRYYNTVATSGELPKDPTRTWVLKTDEHGRASLDDAHRVSGDPLYLQDGATTIPLGTLTVEETKAPKGYLPPEDSLTLYQVVPMGDGATLSQVVEPSEAKPTVLEQVIRGGIKLKKVDSAGKGLAGATFSVTTTSDQPVVVDGKSFEKGSVCLNLTTGQDGTASSNADALPFGTYRITETKAPKGYKIDKAWTTDVTIGNGASIVDLTDDPVTNEPVSVSVPITATKRLEGALPGLGLRADAYSFTLSTEDGTVLQTKRNDATGSVRFDALNFTHDDLGKSHIYLIREVAGDDDMVVYDSHVERFEVSLEEQTDGSIKASLKTDRDGLVFVNEMLSPLDFPLTGRGGIFGAWVAAAASGIAIGVLVRRRSTRSPRP